MGNLYLRDKYNVGDDKKIRKNIYDAIWLVFFFGGMLLMFNYFNTHSTLFLGAVIFVMLSMLIYGIVTAVQIKKNWSLYFLFEAIAIFVLSNIFLLLSFTLYYESLDLNNVTFGIILILLNIWTAVFTWIYYKKKTLENASGHIGKVAVGISLSFGGLGSVIGYTTSRNMSQYGIQIMMIILSYFLSCVFLAVATVHLSKFREISKKNIRKIKKIKKVK